MLPNDEEYQRMQAEHLSWLTSLGKRYTLEIYAAAELLRLEFVGEMELSDNEKQEYFTAIIKATEKYATVVDSTLEERKKYLNSKQRE
jgi:hypothetical protein